ncbi:MAG: NAD-dependent epimerase/dehydratase family protein [Vicinamibacterales bacterium]
MDHRLLVTGGSGLVGQAFQRRWVQPGSLRLVSREDRPGYIQIGGIDGDTRWADVLRGVSTVVHLAARVHIMRDAASDPLSEYRRVNTEGTLNLARQAAAAGARRFVFVSTIKVNGERTQPGRPFRPEDTPLPVDPYAISKYEAEQGLKALARETGLEVVILRPVLVYGPGVRGNFETMLRWLHRGVPLPLGAVNSRRSLLAAANLADLIATCVRHPSAANETFLVSDGEDLTTPDILRTAAGFMGVPARLVPVAPPILRAAAWMTGQQAAIGRLCDWLQVDGNNTAHLLGWTPPVSWQAALQETVADFLSVSR